MTLSKTLTRVSARIPESLLKSIIRVYPKESISEILRDLLEKEILRQKTLKAHMKLYGRFQAKDFDESVL